MGRGVLLPHARRLMLLLRPTGFSTSAPVASTREPLHVCVVGSGPAGFYTAEKMLKGHEGAQVDIIDRLPTPFGLVRSGVAPDHPETKIVVNQFSRVAANARCSFFGNVTLGSDVSLSELRKTYDVVVLAYGAESDRSFGIPGEDLRGIHSAREFVWWYNGHPDMCNLAPDLKNTDSAVVLGQGNVALDVARILLRCTTELASTDIAGYALDALRSSTIRKVFLVGRRGPAQAACTAKELREILGLKNVHVCIKEADLVTSPADKEEMSNSRIKRRVYELLSKAATVHQEKRNDDRKELHFVFFRKPTRFLPSEDGTTVGAVELEKTLLKDDGVTGKQVAVGTGEFEDLKCGLVLKSIGYKSLPIEGLPFDKYRGVVPNLRGRILSNESETATVEPGLYVVGWLKRGPTGIVATNLHCAEETVASILEDEKKGVLVASSDSKRQGRKGLLEILEQKNTRYVPFHDWEKIDSKEKTSGQLKNKPREKITAWDELLKVAKEG
ncbi:NADPH:adrenodoxin oxidoreductase, mitochondrial-like isoform X2 [Lolium rigidum]|uniref:NADPH:adrenodoxin oxidoreductase, mitochondrial-like isoform X2 n=1 Tax=Lolium rigidum TaxID=89674 RepID=UPI001F5C1F11|nr:NADPH:adrenodoxin oxidoreductase, mitochondrial-like isoform X2 [Lolium rigidum]